MSAATHFRLGFVIQVSSFLTLALVNVALPNVIGAAQFSKLNESYAFLGFSCVIFNEGFALLLIRRAAASHNSAADVAGFALQSGLEHVLLVLAALTLVVLATAAIAPSHHYGWFDWLLVGLNGAVIAAYVVGIAWLTATLQNGLVARLAILQGFLSFAAPLAAIAAGVDVRLAICASYLIGVVVCWRLVVSAAPANWRPGLGNDRRIGLVVALLPASAQTAVRLAIVWLPVLVLAAQGEVIGAANYKICVSMAVGACALVPFHKQTMLSLSAIHSEREGHMLRAAVVLVASWVAIVFVTAVQPTVTLLYRQEFTGIAENLPPFAVFVVLHVLTDILLVHMLQRRSDAVLLLAAAAAIGAAAAGLAYLPVQWVPAITLAGFILVSLLADRTILGSWIVARATLLGLLSALLALSMPLWLALVATVILQLGAVAIDRDLRSAVTTLARQMLGR